MACVESEKRYAFYTFDSPQICSENSRTKSKMESFSLLYALKPPNSNKRPKGYQYLVIGLKSMKHTW